MFCEAASTMPVAAIECAEWSARRRLRRGQPRERLLLGIYVPALPEQHRYRRQRGNRHNR